MVALDWLAGIDNDLVIYNLYGKQVQGARRGTSNNFPLRIEE